MKKLILISVAALLLIIGGTFYVRESNQLSATYYLHKNCLFSKVIYSYEDYAFGDGESYITLRQYFDLNIENDENWKTKEDCKELIDYLFIDNKGLYHLESEEEYYLNTDLLEDHCYYFFKALNTNSYDLKQSDMRLYCIGIYDQDTDLLYFVYMEF